MTSLRFAKAAYHDYVGVVLDVAIREKLVADLGDNTCMVLRNQGLLAVGRRLAEAINRMHRMELSCPAQFAAAACQTPLNPVPDDVVHGTWLQHQPQTRRPYGVMQGPALLWMLDRMDPSFRE